MSLFVAMTAAAVGVTVDDGCGGILSGTGSSASVDPSGNLTIATSSSYVPLFGCAASSGAPICNLSASQTSLAPGGTATLYAKCSGSPASYGWIASSNSPALPSNASSLYTFPLTFAAAGDYTYSIAATNGSGQGAVSNQLTILVGNGSSKPVCTLTVSPMSLQAGGKARVQPSCTPVPTSYSWTVDNNGPAMPNNSSGAELTFANAGTFTYKLQASNSIGQAPLASATVTVAAAASPIAFANAGFESPVAPSGGDTPMTTQNQAGWTSITGTVSATSSGELTAINRPTSGSPQFATFNSGTGGKIGQYLNVPNGTYTISVRAQALGGTALTVLMNSSAIYTSPAISNTNWVTYTTPPFSISGNNNVLFEFSAAAGGYLWLDDVAINPATAPAAFVNGSFESPVVADYVFFPSGFGWTSLNPATDGIIANAHSIANGYPAAPDGVQIAWYAAASGLQQSLTLAPGTYTVSFRAMNHSDFPSLTANLTWNGAQVIALVNPPPRQWMLYTSSPFVVGSAGSYLFTFGTGNPGVGGYIYIDDIRIRAQ